MIKLLKGKNIDKSLYGVIDLETVKIGKELIVYSIGFYIKKDNKEYLKLYYLKDYYRNNFKLDSLNMVKICLKDLYSLIPKNKILYLYTHNFGNFDAYLLFNILNDLFNYKLKILMDSNNRFIEIKTDQIIYRDSYRILPASLKKLSQIVNLEKLEFDHETVTLELILSDNKFKKENLNYLKNDLICLYNIIQYFSKILLEKYHLPFYKIYSASHMAFNLFRINFLKKNIPNVKPILFNIIKQSFYGGITQHFIKYGKNLYHYDVNSLYPYAMLNDMPGKYLKYYSSLTTKKFLKDDLFGFFYCEISISNPKISIIPHRISSGNLIYPKNCKIEGLYFSEEIKNWIKLGYKINIKYGYKFSRLKNLFKNYVYHFYKLKSSQFNFLYKLLLNGLYGYFARNPELTMYEIVHNNHLKNILNYYEIYDLIYLSNHYYLVKYSIHSKNLNKDQLQNFLQNHKIKDQHFLSNIAIASAITSYARIIMSKFLLSDQYTVYYTDTDSLFIDKPLNNQFVGTNIGQMKLENIVKEAYFFNNKIYAYINIQNKEIIKTAGIPNHLVTFKDFKDMFQNKFKTYNHSVIIKDTFLFQLTHHNRTFSFQNILKKKITPRFSSGIIFLISSLYY